jgi:ABC-2 type transport system permease protein
MPMYFSRPLRRLDYFAGKLGVIAFFLAGVALLPAVVAYALGIAFSFDLAVLRDTWRLFVGALVYGSVIVLSAGTLMLAMSSLSRNSRLVGALFVGLWMVGDVTSESLRANVHRDWCPLVSYTTNLVRIREEVLDMPAARGKFLALWEAGQAAREEAAAAARRSFFPFGRARRRPPPPPPTEPPWIVQTPEYLRFPWTWSAGVLSGLFGLSIVTLSTRIRSLDRLR